MFNLKKALVGALTLLPLLYTQVSSASIVSYSDRASFEAALGSLITDDYANPGYTFIQSDAAMSGVLGETDYRSTGFPSHNIVTTGGYCAGCNGSFELSFLTTSLSLATGVYGVGFDITTNSNSEPYDAYVTFGDDSTQNFDLPIGASFFGLTADTLIKSIHLGLANGGTTTSGSFQIDNLTIGNRGTVPEPASLLLLGLGALGMGWARRQHKLGA